MCSLYVCLSVCLSLFMSVYLSIYLSLTIRYWVIASGNKKPSCTASIPFFLQARVLFICTASYTLVKILKKVRNINGYTITWILHQFFLCHNIVYSTSIRTMGKNCLLLKSIIKIVWGLLLNLIGWLIKISVQTFQPIIIIYRRGNFVYHLRECTSIYRSLSYPFRSLI